MKLLALLLLSLPALAADLDVDVARKMLAAKAGDQLLLPAVWVTNANGEKCRMPAGLVTVDKADSAKLTFRNPNPQPGTPCKAPDAVTLELRPAREALALAEERIILWDKRNERELALTFIPKEHKPSAKCPYDPGVSYRFTSQTAVSGFGADGKKKDCTAGKGGAVKAIGCTSTGRAVALVEQGKGDCAAGDVLVGKLPLEPRFPLTEKIRGLFGGSAEEGEDSPSGSAE